MGSTDQADSPPGSDAAEELAAIARGLRAQLAWRSRGGAYAAVGTAMARTEPTVTGSDSVSGSGSGSDSVSGSGSGSDSDSGSGSGSDSGSVSGSVAARSLSIIRAELGDCQRCKLCKTRNQIVFGVGPEPATLMFIGEGPGADEDRTGQPFVGKAGQLLDKMIEAMGWGRDDVYIANVVKCRPPGNRNPEADEIAACRPFLEAQIGAVRPRIIVTLGRPAANLVLGNDAPISALRGRFHDFRGVRVMPTFHPAYLLREPERKRDAWSDLKQVMAELERLGIPAPRPTRG